MHIFQHELKSYRQSIIIWACSMAALAVMFIFIFSSAAEEMDSIKDVLGSLPEAMREMLGIYVDSVSTLEGFYSFVFVYVLLCGAIQAMNVGTSIVSKEISDKTADFLLTKPIKRDQILTYKLLAAISTLIITNILYLIITIPVTLTVKSDYNMTIFLLISVTLLFVQCIFMSLGVLISVLVGRIKSVISISLSTVFGFFIIGAMGSLLGDQAVKYISPFKYYDTAYIITHSAYEPSFLIVGAIFFLIATTLSYVVYIKKDIHAV
jgi:ABC-2 type transport system permease protein